jgi:enoyl-CoA hydratase/carnithine racemase
MKFTTLKYEVINNVANVVLNNPPKNEMDFDFFEELTSIINNIKNDKELIGVVFSSTGRHFSSGTNVNNLLTLFKDYDNKERPKEIESNVKVFKDINNLRIPSIACIKGICYGSALELALSCQIRIASANARLSLPETEFDIIPGLFGIYKCREIIGFPKSLDFILSNESYTAQEAIEIGMIDHIVKKEDHLTEAVKIINAIRENYNKNKHYHI